MKEHKILIKIFKQINKEIDLREENYDGNHTAIIVEGLKIARSIIKKEEKIARSIIKKQEKEKKNVRSKGD